MSEEKIKILMTYYNVENVELLHLVCPINLDNWLYNFMDNESFINMVGLIDNKIIRGGR